MALVGLCLAVAVAQTAPQISAFFVPARTTVSDQLTSPDEVSLWARLTGQAERDRRIRELEDEVRNLSRYRQAFITLSERLESYERILNVMGEPPERGVTARVTTEIRGPFARTLLANAGRRQGVAPGSVALNEGGLVGRVIHLGERSSRILLISDYSSRVPVMGEISGLRAILRDGDADSGRLLDFPEPGGFAEGERILTSGDGGVFPRGLVVGTVFRNGQGWRVRFAKDAYPSHYVRLIAPPVIEPPLPDEAVTAAQVPAPAERVQ